jgi:hypothetical protein
LFPIDLKQVLKKQNFVFAKKCFSDLTTQFRSDIASSEAEFCSVDLGFILVGVMANIFGDFHQFVAKKIIPINNQHFE